MVVQTFPELLMQGHGSAMLNQGAMWKAMIKYFRDELTEHRAAVDGLAHIERFGPNTLVVDQSQFLGSGMRVDIVQDDAGEAVLAADRQIVSVSGRTVRLQRRQRVGAGASPAAARPRNALRRSEGSDRRQHVPPRAPNAAGNVAIRGGHQRADWFLIWRGAGGGRGDSQGRRTGGVRQGASPRRVHARAGIRESDDDRLVPAVASRDEGGSPVRRNGRIVSTDPVEVRLRNIAGWTWFFDPDPAKRDLVPVIRPREL